VIATKKKGLEKFPAPIFFVVLSNACLAPYKEIIFIP
jgi:hypothetical protein